MSKCINIKQKINKEVWCKYHDKKLTKELCLNCEHREYKENNNIAVKNVTKVSRPIKGKKHKLTKATEIPKEVKLKVWERDKHRCIFCGKEVPWNLANSHYVKRSQLGLGIEENIMTNCERCHALYEESIYREDMMLYARKYLMNLYPNWDESKLIYKKR